MLMEKLRTLVAPATYKHVTEHVAEQMAWFIVDARRHSGLDALICRERAYGLYIGWRALAVEMVDPTEFFRDDQRLELLLNENGRRSI